MPESLPQKRSMFDGFSIPWCDGSLVMEPHMYQQTWWGSFYFYKNAPLNKAKKWSKISKWNKKTGQT